MFTPRQTVKDFTLLPKDAAGFVRFEKVFTGSDRIEEDSHGGLDALVSRFAGLIHHEFIISTLEQGKRESKKLHQWISCYFTQSAADLPVGIRSQDTINDDDEEEDSRQSRKYYDKTLMVRVMMMVVGGIMTTESDDIGIPKEHWLLLLCARIGIINVNASEKENGHIEGFYFYF